MSFTKSDQGQQQRVSSHQAPTFWGEPKMIRVARNLESTLKELCEKKWTKYLLTVVGDEATSPLHLKMPSDFDINKIVKMHRFSRPKDHFSWDLIPSNPFLNSELANNNAELEYKYYADLLEQAKIVFSMLTESDNPDFPAIGQMLQQIKDSSYRSNYGNDLHKVGYEAGGNIFVDLVTGLVGILHALIMFAVGAVYALPHHFEKSEYCGGSEFFIDTASYFLESTLQVIGSLFPPLGMLYSKYTTDSFNTLTEGKLRRTLDGLLSLVGTEIQAKMDLDKLNATYKSDHTIGY